MNNNPTVCLLNDSFPPLIDGVANAVKNYAENLTATGFNPVVITPAHPDAEDADRPYPVVRYPSIDLRDKTGYMAGIPFSPELVRQLEGRNISILHSHCPIASTILARELRSVADAPLILTYHTKFDIDIAAMVRSHALQAGSKRALVANISACDEVWAVSHGAGENLRSLGYQGDYIVMPNGVDLPRERVSQEQCQSVSAEYDLPENVPVFLFVGRIRWYKGLKIILDAMAKLHNTGQDFRMVFVGDGSDKNDVENYSILLGLSSRCFFTGALSDREVLRAWYCRGDLFLFPSTFDTNGLVVREAAACSLASVLIQGSCAAEGVADGRNGFLIRENADSLFSLLSELCDHPEKMRQVGQHAAEELYLSWADAVALASRRYEIVMDRFLSGKYPPRKHPLEHVLRKNGELMEDLAKIQDMSANLREQLRDLFE